MNSLTTHTINAANGSAFACIGCIRGLVQPEFRNSYKSISWIIGCMLLVAFLGYIAIFPIHIVLWIIGDTSIQMAIRNALHRSIASIPFILIAIIRYVNPTLFEQLFFLGVEMENPTLAATISKIPVDYFTWEYMKSVLLFLVYRLLLMIVLGLGTALTPIFGGLFALLTFGYKIRRMELMFSCVLFVLYILPWTQSIAIDLTRLWFDSRAIARELFTPFIDRQYGIPDLEPKGVPLLKWPRVQAMIFGFSYTMGYFVQIQYIGPFFWFLGSISAGIFTSIVLKQQDKSKI